MKFIGEIILIFLACRGLYPGCRACASDENLIIANPVKQNLILTKQM
jgi:hypothetical protein